MDAIARLKALEPRLDAVIAAQGTDTSTAVDAATKPLKDQILQLQNEASQRESDFGAEVDNVITPKVVALEAGVGITFTPPPEGQAAS